MCEILNHIGVTTKFVAKNTLEIDARNITSTSAPVEMTAKMRASYYLIGALLGREKECTIGIPGGCNIGQRPIDQHIKAFEQLGADVEVACGKVIAKAHNLKGKTIYFDVVSVGATINAMLCACFAKGETILNNVAKEPHIVDVANFLNSAGAKIFGAGTDTINIEGVRSLKGNHTYSVIPDQIEAGTFMIAACASRGDVLIKNCTPEHMEPLTAKLIEAGADVSSFEDQIHVICPNRLEAVDVKTLPYPGFPTDLQSPMGTLMAVANGTSIITESIWESRFQYTTELMKMGATITVQDKTAVFEGVEKLVAAPIYASDLRAGAALMIAGLIAEGTSELYNVSYIERGYEHIEEKFRKLGAKIETK